MKLYEILLDGYHTPLPSEEIRTLFKAGRLRRSDPCKEVGATSWRTIDEVLPLLKYDSIESAPLPPPQGNDRRPSMAERSNEVRPMTSALKAGWVCFGIALAVSWFFPPGNLFFSVALITAVVAMCTHQVNRGLALFAASLAGIAVCTVVFFTLVIGAVGMAAAPAIKKADQEMNRMQRAQTEALTQLAVASKQIQSVVPSAPLKIPASSFKPTSNPNVTPQLAVNAERARQRVSEQERESAQREAADRAQRQANVREAERQRDLARAKEQQLQQLQKSLDWWDDQIQKCRVEGRDWSWASAQRDAAVRQKAELLGR
ncbi:MAG: hypothetical protein ABJF10_29960 [Chthoniobacter sp.]